MQNIRQTARSQILGNLWASGSTFVVKDWEWAIFSEAGDVFLEHFESGVCTKREPVTMTRDWDEFTITARKSQLCVQNDWANPKTRTQEAYSFEAGDYVTEYFSEKHYNDLKTAINWKANDSEVVKKTWNQTINGNLTATEFHWDWSNLTGINAEVQSASLEYFLWEAGVVGKWYSLIDYEQLDFENAIYFWSASRPYIWQKIYWQWELPSLTMILRTVGSPDDWVKVEIQTDDWSGLPSGTIIDNWTSNTINYADINSSFDEETFTFSTPVNLTEWELYHVVLKRTGWNSDVNRYEAWRTTLNGDFIGQAILNDWSTWVWASWDMFIKLPWYKLVVKWGVNFIGICQIAWTEWQKVKFNTQFDWNQTGLTPWNMYTWDSSNWDVVAWNDFRALSETEISYDISVLWSNPFFWNWWDWDLEVTSWTTQITAGQTYNYWNLKIDSWATLEIVWSWTTTIKVARVCTLNGTISTEWQWNTWSIVLNWQTITPWSSWIGWAGGTGWNSTINWTKYGWAGGTGSSAWYGWGWGGWASDSYNWWAGGVGWTPAWTGWSGYNCSWTIKGAWWNAYWENWVAGQWCSQYHNWQAGWISAWWSGSSSNGAGAWWGWGWDMWAKWGNLFFYVNKLEWDWTLNARWWQWGSWGNWGNWGSSWGGWGWGWGWWGGWGWAVGIVYWTDSSSITIDTAWGTWWTGWSAGAWNWSYWKVWVAWSSGGSWTNWNSLSLNVNSL